MLFVERKPLPRLQFVFSWLFSALVKAGDQNLPLSILQLVDDLNQSKQRIRRGASVHARVQIRLCADRLNLRVDKAAQTDTKSGKIGCEELRIADQRKIGLQLRFLLADVLRNRFATNFLLALKNNLDVDRQLAAMSLHQRLEGFHLHPELALVVDRAACIEIAVALGPLEGR